ncbi:DUF1016 N-terminal domain-containing protein [Bradyrhizobium neotropicale]|uniref:DUF1016 N-terminal domain-containing protein n=1 Tax=Bradyrhizobium neotropicale TaxID=1497615 RepID=UPI001FED5AB4|nr:DUF1016 N-terminal domain-containing protein [Bradyrhizobium neotropicale]
MIPSSACPPWQADAFRPAEKSAVTCRQLHHAMGHDPRDRDRHTELLGFVGDLKTKIAEARHRAGLSVNRELILLYWTVGCDILIRQEKEGWGAKVIDRLADDLGRAFPEMKGLSARNLKYMRAFAEAWPDREFVRQVVALLPWGNNVRLLDAVKAPEQRAWYARQAIEHGRSRNVLLHQIDCNLFVPQGSALTNFSRTLPAEQSELAQQILKDPYTFDFPSLGPEMLEGDLKLGPIEHLRAPFSNSANDSPSSHQATSAARGSRLLKC